MKLKPIAPNQTELHLEKFVVFFSYDTPVAYYNKLRPDTAFISKEHFSRTTSRHINRWTEGRYVQKVSQENIERLVEGSKND